MEQNITILEGYGDAEKGAYLSAIASLATVDTSATQEEIDYITTLCESADLSPQQTEEVVKAAQETSGEELTRHLDVLKNSDLKYSLVADLMTFAKTDNVLSPEEDQNIKKIAQYLQIDQQQLSLLNQVAEKATATASPEEAGNPNMFFGSGLKEKLQQSGINTSGLLKGLLGIAGPMILARIVSGAFGRRGGGGMGSGLNPFGRSGGSGGSLAGGGGMLGSLISMLSRGRGFSSSGGLLGRVLRGGF